MPGPPRLLILSGPNGAGKSTFAGVLLAAQPQSLTFLNADVEARRISPGNEAAAAIPAGRAVLTAMSQMIGDRESFAIETTLSGRRHLALARDAAKQGWMVDLHFLWLDSVALAMRRVDARVAAGGHDIPKNVIERRYRRGLINLPVACELASRWTIYDNSNGLAEPVAGGDLADFVVYDSKLFDRIRLYDRTRWLTALKTTARSTNT